MVASAFRRMLVTGRQLRAARALADMGQRDLARKAKVSVGTIRRIEQDGGVIVALSTTIKKIQVTLEKAGVEFLNGDRPGVRMMAPVKK